MCRYVIVVPTVSDDYGHEMMLYVHVLLWCQCMCGVSVDCDWSMWPVEVVKYSAVLFIDKVLFQVFK